MDARGRDHVDEHDVDALVQHRDDYPQQGTMRCEIARAERMLANEQFVGRAPSRVVEAEREKLARYRRELDAVGG